MPDAESHPDVVSGARVVTGTRVKADADGNLPYRQTVAAQPTGILASANR